METLTNEWNESYSNLNNLTQSMKKILYKYYSPNAISEKYIDTLQNKQFWFGGNQKLNDPYDLLGANRILPSYIMEKIKETIKILIKNESSDRTIAIEQTIFQQLRNCFKQFACCCFSRVATDRLMWAHYTSGYEGFCIEYTFSNVETSEKEPKNVLYLDNFPVLDTQSGETYLDSNNIHLQPYLKRWLTSRNPKDLYDLVSFLACIKSQEWVYEQEERLVTIINREEVGANRFWANYNARPTKIILGPKFASKNMETINTLLSIWKLNSNNLYKLTTNQLTHFDLCIRPC